MDLQQITFLVILAATLALFISEKLRIDLVALLALLALTLTGILGPKEALSGFSSEPAIIVAAVFVLSAGLSATGITDRIGAGIARAAGGSEWRTIAVVMPATANMAVVRCPLAASWPTRMKLKPGRIRMAQWRRAMVMRVGSMGDVSES